MNNIKILLDNNNIKLGFKTEKYENSHLIDACETEWSGTNDEYMRSEPDGTIWRIAVEAARISEGIVDIHANFVLERGKCSNSNVSILIREKQWSKDNFVLMPAAVYNGNRFKSRDISYPPQVSETEDLGIGAQAVITDVPRLNINEGISEIQLLTRDLSTPAIGYHKPAESSGLWLMTQQSTVLGDSGIKIEENEDRSSAVISVAAPGVRHDTRYIICNTKFPSEDKGVDFKEGDSVKLNVRLYLFRCRSIQDLYDYFVDIRKDLTGEVKLKSHIPFSKAWEIQQKKYNEQNWEDEHGYYSVGLRESVPADWQIGWVGGLMSTYPMIFEGSQLSRARALKTFEFAFSGGQDKTGFFYGCGHQGKWYGDNFADNDRDWHLIRKSSDALYFAIKQFMLLKKQNENFSVPGKWLNGTRKCADAFVRLWKAYGQFGQFVDSGTGEIIVDGSTSAGIAPGGLALAGQFFGEKTYLDVAEASANFFYENYVKKGFTTGGPGEICQCPDSESAFGLLESFVVLYEVTGNRHWVDKARDIANQCFTWCVSYDFKFPSYSTFGSLDMHTAGSVYANVQNKHSAPGICTLSGDSLFKLYRATGDVKYLELIREIAHNQVQYLSREDRPIKALEGYWPGKNKEHWSEKFMPAGWMNERVQMSDWLEPIGEVFYSSCWCEISNMLTYMEVPGLYVQLDTGFICVIDNIEAVILENGYKKLVLKLINPTEFDAKVKMFSEKSSDISRILGQNVLWGCREVNIKAGANVIMEFFKS